jgi:hypothetical protein
MAVSFYPKNIAYVGVCLYFFKKRIRGESTGKKSRNFSVGFRYYLKRSFPNSLEYPFHCAVALGLGGK